MNLKEVRDFAELRNRNLKLYHFDEALCSIVGTNDGRVCIIPASFVEPSASYYIIYRYECSPEIYSADSVVFIYDGIRFPKEEVLSHMQKIIEERKESYEQCS